MTKIKKQKKLKGGSSVCNSSKKNHSRQPTPAQLKYLIKQNKLDRLNNAFKNRLNKDIFIFRNKFNYIFDKALLIKAIKKNIKIRYYPHIIPVLQNWREYGVIKKKYKHYSLHRLLYESHINRKLKKTEIIHHIDGNKYNNNIDNLQLLTQGEHNFIHAEMRKKERLSA